MPQNVTEIFQKSEKKFPNAQFRLKNAVSATIFTALATVFAVSATAFTALATVFAVSATVFTASATVFTASAVPNTALGTAYGVFGTAFTTKTTRSGMERVWFTVNCVVFTTLPVRTTCGGCRFWQHWHVFCARTGWFMLRQSQRGVRPNGSIPRDITFTSGQPPATAGGSDSTFLQTLPTREREVDAL